MITKINEFKNRINEAVYREGYMCLDIIQKNSVQIYNDAADFGALFNRGDKIFNAAKQLIEWYQKEGTEIKRHKYETGEDAEAIVQLIDEWAVSDERKTMAEATETYRVHCVTSKNGIKYQGKTYIGYVYVEKI